MKPYKHTFLSSEVQECGLTEMASLLPTLAEDRYPSLAIYFFLALVDLLLGAPSLCRWGTQALQLRHVGSVTLRHEGPTRD